MKNMLKDTAAKKAPKTRRSRKKATAAVTEAPAAEAANEEKKQLNKQSFLQAYKKKRFVSHGSLFCLLAN